LDQWERCGPLDPDVSVQVRVSNDDGCGGHHGWGSVPATEIAALKSIKPRSLLSAARTERPERRKSPFDRSSSTINEVLDAGINYIDTSIDYGLSEERIGRYISHRRGEYYLASKCGCLVGAPPTPRGQRGQHVFTRENVVAGVEQSLPRMKTDYLDIVQFHSSPSRQTLEEHGALEALLELREAGKVRFIGMSGTLPYLTDHIAMGVFDVFQIPYSAVEREHEAAIATAAQKGAGIVIRGGAAKGAPTEGKQAGLQWER
jgi:aryl-alcohol dehydrogenase-like predicted oxidoreductase